MERALLESKRSLGEVVDEVVFCEKELDKLKGLNARLQDRIRELESEQGSDSNAVRSLKQMLAQQQDQFASQKRELIQRAEARIQQVEQELAQQKPSPTAGSANLELATERSMRQDLERTLTTVSKERDQARSELLAWSISNNVSLQENKSMEDQKRAMLQEIEKYQRQAEAAIREQRASEKRFDALAEEMRQVMEERDEAMAAKESLRVQKNDEASLAQRCKAQADELSKQNLVLKGKLEDAERQRDAYLTQKQSEERLRLQIKADVEVLRAQNSTLTLEKELAIRENQVILDRLDQALGARRLAVAARGEAQKQIDDLTKAKEMVEADRMADGRRIAEMENAMRTRAEEMLALKQQQNAKNAELRDAVEAVKEYKELKEEAEREVEAARRQIRGLNEEMLSCLKARDLAFNQRDDAFHRLGEGGGGSGSSQPPPAAAGALMDDKDRMLGAAKHQIEALETQLGPLNAELEDLRLQSRETEQALRRPLETSKRELLAKSSECDALREEKRVLAAQVRELQGQLRSPSASGSASASAASAPRSATENSLREKLRNLMIDFDHIESENRKLKGLF